MDYERLENMLMYMAVIAGLVIILGTLSIRGIDKFKKSHKHKQVRVETTIETKHNLYNK